ncbi:hypothetical protein [Glycomyces harbinensis]|uniref:Uncharacterized protein n=1 Tax=Glycomyces harbinensis TaxID=58114 RepID=A0A1G6V3C4_9ACTN|nr:hypothetical protein [Glycomyces harbinensis]SDD47983.1 hypothetical protein SAMN05216270_104179 [Glycomyces harbinensis]
MKSQKDSPGTNAEPAFESDALRLSDIAGRDAAEIARKRGNEPDHLIEDEQEIAAKDDARQIVLAVVAVGVAAAVVIGLKIAYDRRKSQRGYRKVVGQLEDAREALLSAASELPERGREALHQLDDRGRVVLHQLDDRGRDVLHRLKHR